MKMQVKICNYIHLCVCTHAYYAVIIRKLYMYYVYNESSLNQTPWGLKKSFGIEGFQIRVVLRVYMSASVEIYPNQSLLVQWHWDE